MTQLEVTFDELELREHILAREKMDSDAVHRFSPPSYPSRRSDAGSQLDVFLL